MRQGKIIGLLLMAIVLSGCEKVKVTTQEELSLSKEKNMENEQIEAKEVSQVVLTVNKGKVILELYPDKAPETVKNFLKKAEAGFYEGLTFHRVEDWVVQGGDPDGNGTGGGEIKTELNQVPFEVGSLGVARGGKIEISNDSQFFICTQDCAWLTGQYTNFGKVIQGMEVVKKIKIGDKITSIELVTEE